MTKARLFQSRTVCFSVVLFSSFVLADQGYIFSRANCINNESITFHQTSELRRTLSKHTDTLYGGSHTISSSSTLVDTPRSAAIHPGEGYPTIYIKIARIPYPCGFETIVHNNETTAVLPVFCYMEVPLPEIVFDRWFVSGTHIERIDNLQLTRYTSTRYCQ